MNISSNWNWQNVAGGYEIDAEGSPNSIALDAKGVPHIFFTHASNTSHRYRMARWEGSRWRFHLVDQRSRQPGGDVTLTVDRKGISHLAYISVADSQNADLYYVRHDGEWKTMWIHFGSAAIRPLWCSVVVDSKDHPHVVYYDAAPQRKLKVASFDGSNWRTTVIADTGNSVGLWCSAVMDSHDRLHVACHDNTSFKLMYAVGSGSSFTLQVADPTPPTGYCCRLALDPQGHPHIVSTTVTGRHIPAEVRHSWHDGQAWHVETIVTKAAYGSPVAIAIDSLGRIHVMWQYVDTFDFYLSIKDAGKWTDELAWQGHGHANFASLVFDAQDVLHVALGERSEFWRELLHYGTRQPGSAQPGRALGKLSTSDEQREPVIMLDEKMQPDKDNPVFVQTEESFPFPHEPV